MVVIPPLPASRQVSGSSSRPRQAEAPRRQPRHTSARGQPPPLSVHSKQTRRRPLQDASENRLNQSVLLRQRARPPKHDLDDLWKEVRLYNKSDIMPGDPGYMRQTAASEGRSGRLSSRPSSNTLSTQSNVLKAEHKDFQSQAQRGYNIRVNTTSASNQTAYGHFRSTEYPSSDNAKDWYQNLHSNTTIWLALDDEEAEFIAECYQELRDLNSNEAQYADRARQLFFKRDGGPKRKPASREPANTGPTRRCLRELEWGPAPNDAQRLFCPPMLDATSKVLTFNTNPDCSYWICLLHIGPAYRMPLFNWTYVRQPAKTIAPYLTVEFKQAGKPSEEALNQLAVTSCLMVYNRLLLRCRRLQAQQFPPDQWNDSHFANLRHYGVTFNANMADVYVATPILDFTNAKSFTFQDASFKHPWAGCRLQCLDRCDVMDPISAVGFCQWVNEVHNWGLGKHTRSIQDDTKEILKNTSTDELLLSRLSMTEEEKARAGQQDPSNG